MIVAAPRLLSDEWMLIGRQEYTGFGRIDLLAIAPDGALVLIELKRNRTPREVVGQALDYAGWVEKLAADDIVGVYGRFAPGRSLAADFRQRFGHDLDEDSLNQSHQIIIVASSLDDSTERIVSYLTERDISEPWNGEFYASFGEGESRSWADAVEYGFICGGGGAWYSKTLNLLNAGDRVWVKVPGYGFVGVGRVMGRAQPAADFRVITPEGEVPVLDVAKGGHLPPRVRQRPRALRIFRARPVAANRTDRKPVPRDRPVRLPEYRLQVYEAEVAERLKERFPNFDKI